MTKRNIVIVGTGLGVRRAPLKDTSKEIWGITGLWNIEGNYSRIYEVHSAKCLTEEKIPADKGEWMANHVTHIHPTLKASFPNAKVIDFEKHMEKHGRYFTSSFSWMLAEAIEEKVDSIDIFGITLSGNGEYSHQKPAASYLIGWARALGIKITIDRESELMSAPYIYGYEDAPEYIKTLSDQKKRVMDELKKADHAELVERGRKHYYEGVRDNIEWFENNFWAQSRVVK